MQEHKYGRGGKRDDRCTIIVRNIQRFCVCSDAGIRIRSFGRERSGILVDFMKNIAGLLKVKTIVTFVIIGVFAVLALRGDITADNVMVIASTVIAFYFGTQLENNKAG